MTEDRDYLAQALLRKVAHDIVGSAGVTRGALAEIERSSGALDDQQAALFGMARRGLTRLERIARRLRFAALADAAELTPALASCDLREVLAAATAEALELDGRKTVVVEKVIPDEPVLVRADQELLKIALAEVVSNAVRFARKSVRLEIDKVGDRARVLADDDGPGFPAGFIVERPHLRSREGQRGSGLSLACVLSIVEHHGGTFAIEARPTRGPEDKPGGSRVRVELTAG